MPRQIRMLVEPLERRINNEYIMSILQRRCKAVAIVGTDCNVSATLLQLLISIATNYWNLYATRLQRCKLHRMQPILGSTCNVATTLLQLHIFNLIFWLHTVQFATLQPCCMEVLIVCCNCNVVATLLQLQIFNSIFDNIRCSLQRFHNFA